MISKINPSKYNRKVDIWTKKKEKNKLKEIVEVDVLNKSIWCKVIPIISSQIKGVEDTILVRTTHKFICRYQTGKDILNTDFIMVDNKKYEILYILNPFESNIELEIFTEYKE